MKKFPFRVCSEMEDLREYLTKRHIEWWDKSDNKDEWWICRTHFMIKGNHWSVIHGYGTYGGICTFSNRDWCLLELMTNALNDGEPLGSLSVKQIIEYIEEETKEDENKNPG